MTGPTTVRPEAEIAAGMLRIPETGVADPVLFAPDVFCDFTQPTWRSQTAGRAATIALRTDNHPWPSRVTRHRVGPRRAGRSPRARRPRAEGAL